MAIPINYPCDCSTCGLWCDDQTEFNCKENNYRYWTGDPGKIERYQKEKAKEESKPYKILATEEEIKDITSKAKHTINFGIQECSKCQYKLRCEECCYNEKEIGELIKSEKQLMATNILNEIEGFLWETAINYTKDFDFCESLYRSIKEHFKNKYGVTREN